MTATIFLAVPVLVWRFFHARRLAMVTIALWLGPWLYLVAFDLAMSGCANVPYTAVGGYLDCPTKAHDMIHTVLGRPAAFLFVLLTMRGPTIALVLLGLAIILELALRRRRKHP